MFLNQLFLYAAVNQCMACLMFSLFCHRIFEDQSDHTMFKLAIAFVFISCFLLTAEARRLPGAYYRAAKPRYRDQAAQRFLEVSC